MADSQATHVELTRVVPASPGRLFEVWTTPAELMKCFGLRRAEVDLRVGGEWLWDGPGGPIGGVFRDVESPGRLVFTLQKADGHEAAVGEAVVTLTFRPAPDGVGTEVFLTHQNVHLPEQAASHAGWWTDRLAALERYAAGEERP